ncbi:MAG: two-component sensor histidine kinase [Moraxellaceae bacterium]|nr:MAG: two-component sensor histidine kinase [Moraxellaceae bacterium]
MVLLIWALVIFSQSFSLWFTFFHVYIPGVKQAAQLVSLEMRTLETSMSLTDKQTFIDALMQEQPEENSVFFTIDENDVPDETSYVMTDLFVEPMKDVLGAGALVRLGVAPKPGMWVSNDALNGIWIHLPLVHFLPYDGLLVTTWVVGTPTVAFLLAAIFARRFSRRLKRLEEAARRIGRGEPVMTLDMENGPKEIIAVNQAFNQMRTSLERETRERALLLAGISHDLRTPLTRMRLSAEFLGENDRELQEGVIRDIQDMDDILDQFIAFIRDGDDEATDVGDLNEVLQEVASQFQADDVDLSLHTQPVPDISLKRLSLKRMFGNLVGNAIRHGGGKVDVYSGMENGEICVVVADRGPGLTEKEMLALFQPFARGDESRSTQGSGLGLAIVKRIVDMHHGRVELRNREGGGLEARVYLPVTGEMVPPESMMARMR